MFWIIHALVGIILGIALNNVLLVITLAVLIHFLFDMLPHWDSNFDRQGFQKKGRVKIDRPDILIRGLDLFLTLVLFISLYSDQMNNMIIVGVFFSLFPDIIKLGYYTHLRQNTVFAGYLRFHSSIQPQTRVFWGLFVQVLVFAFLILLLYYFIH